MKGDKYPDMTAKQCEQFLATCNAEELDPTRECPLCRSKRLTRSPGYEFCDTHSSWEHRFTWVDCHRDRIRWAVTLADACTEPTLRATTEVPV
jgi:hypothetical protein